MRLIIMTENIATEIDFDSITAQASATDWTTTEGRAATLRFIAQAEAAATDPSREIFDQCQTAYLVMKPARAEGSGIKSTDVAEEFAKALTLAYAMQAYPDDDETSAKLRGRLMAKSRNQGGTRLSATAITMRADAWDFVLQVIGQDETPAIDQVRKAYAVTGRGLNRDELFALRTGKPLQFIDNGRVVVKAETVKVTPEHFVTDVTKNLDTFDTFAKAREEYKKAKKAAASSDGDSTAQGVKPGDPEPAADLIERLKGINAERVAEWSDDERREVFKLCQGVESLIRSHSTKK